MATTLGNQRHITFGGIAGAMRSALKRLMWPLVVLAGAETALLFMTKSPAATAFLLISSSSLAALSVWANFGRGLPMFALLVAQNLVIYALPIIAGNDIVFQYPAQLLTNAGWEVFTFNFVMLIAWRIGIAVIQPSSSLCYALLGLDNTSPKLTRLGISLLLIGSGYELLNSLNALGPVLSLLPAGSNSIIHAIISAVSACGFFLCGLMVGKGLANRAQRGLFWSLLAMQCLITAAGFLLSAAVLVVFAATIGLFWGSGRLPWRFITVVVVTFGFLNLGKFTMREKYWNPNDGEPGLDTSLGAMPGVYREWAGASIDILTGTATATSNSNAFTHFGEVDETKVSGQSLLQRVNNLENLLFAIDAEGAGHIKPLGGATYTLIPPLLVPRVLWPDKPRSHEGQVMLNVHFGRQDMNSTFHTYIAWGLLPEAYGNFGPIAGAVILGLFLGFLFAWIEQFVARKLVLSLEGFLGFTLFLGTANSYEMVASVLVTSLFQAFVPIIIASAPFVARIAPRTGASPRAPEASPEGPATS